MYCKAAKEYMYMEVFKEFKINYVQGSSRETQTSMTGIQ